MRLPIVVRLRRLERSDAVERRAVRALFDDGAAEMHDGAADESDGGDAAAMGGPSDGPRDDGATEQQRPCVLRNMQCLCSERPARTPPVAQCFPHAQARGRSGHGRAFGRSARRRCYGAATAVRFEEYAMPLFRTPGSDASRCPMFPACTGSMAPTLLQRCRRPIYREAGVDGERGI
jgi:hypothetical protein